MSLPIPAFTTIREVHLHRWMGSGGGYAELVMIAPNRHAGRRNVYTVIRMHLDTGHASCIGRELDLNIARAVASRPSSEDGTPIVPKKRQRGVNVERDIRVISVPDCRSASWFIYDFDRSTTIYSGGRGEIGRRKAMARLKEGGFS